MYKRFLLGATAGVSAMTMIVAAMPMTSYAATQYTQRKKIVVSSNIMDSFEATLNNTSVTRAQFAKMLVRASSYNNAVSAYNDVSVFPDVPKDSEYASYIRVATEQGWMSAYLGGKFRPDEPIKYHEAVRACLYLLGYEDSDFTGNQVASRVAKAQSIGLSSDIAKTAITEELDYQDCVNLFYNLMITNTKSNENSSKSSQTIYGKLVGFELDSNNEINMLDSLESNLKGPYLLKSGKKLSSKISFSTDDAVCYLNGQSSSVDEIEEEAETETVVIYYNASTKSVYAYSTNASDDTTSVRVITGVLTSINYASSDIMTPSSITIDDDGNNYLLNNSDMQYAFSVYGSVDSGEEITIVYQVNSSDEKEVIAYMQD